MREALWFTFKRSLNDLTVFRLRRLDGTDGEWVDGDKRETRRTTGQLDHQASL